MFIESCWDDHEPGIFQQQSNWPVSILRPLLNPNPLASSADVKFMIHASDLCHNRAGLVPPPTIVQARYESKTNAHHAPFYVRFNCDLCGDIFTPDMSTRRPASLRSGVAGEAMLWIRDLGNLHLGTGRRDPFTNLAAGRSSAKTALKTHRSFHPTNQQDQRVNSNDKRAPWTEDAKQSHNISKRQQKPNLALTPPKSGQTPLKSSHFQK